VIDYNGRRISFGRATGRAFSIYINDFTCYLLYLMVAFIQRKQAVEDVIAKTYAVRKNSIIA
jgi:uncharacterized RDD family membrane protein YckC